MKVRNKGFGVLAALVVSAFGSVAAAQDWESGDTGSWGTPPDQTQQQQTPPAQQQTPPAQQQQWNQQQQPQQQGWQQQQGQQQQQAGWQQQQGEQPPGWGETPPGGAEEDGQSDHEMVVGHMGVGFFGVEGVTLADDFSISAPTIGIRMWLSESLGLDLALGFGFTNVGGEVDSPDGVASADLLEGFAFALHAGIPLALWHHKHYKFLIVPEIEVGYGSGTLFGATPNDDEEFSGFFFGVGARAGAEVHFGFMGIPDLSLQGSVGLGFQFESRSREFAFGDPRGSTIETVDQFRLGTTVQNNPWNILIANIAAIYYFR